MSDSIDADAAALYQQLILDRSRHPRHAHRPDPVDAEASGDNPMCGDRVRVFVQRGDAGTIADVGHEARGCAISLAAADLMTDAVRGATPARIRALDAAFTHMIDTGTDADADLGDLRALAGVHDYPSRRRCATLPWQALRAALAQLDPQP